MIDKFRAHFSSHNEYSKTCRFEATIFPPICMNNADTAGLKFQCETAELPGYNVNTVDGRVYGGHYAVAATPVFSDLNLTFICAGDLWEKQFFDDWMNEIMPKDQYKFSAKYRDKYITTIEIKQFDELSAPSYASGPDDLLGEDTESSIVRYHVKFLEAFPTSVAPIALTWADDSIARLSVTFKYRLWNQVPIPISNSTMQPETIVRYT